LGILGQLFPTGRRRFYPLILSLQSCFFVHAEKSSLHDLIQPSFSFLVGVALPYSMARRGNTGQTRAWLVVHACWRALVLIGLGIFLRSMGQNQTNFTFVDTLTQIGFGYVPLFLLGLTRTRWHWVALIVILIGYWGAFVAYPLPSDDFILDSFHTHFGSDIFRLLGDQYASLLSGGAILAVYGAILYWMYHRRLFLKI
jgi:predicted acyltransferase